MIFQVCQSCGNVLPEDSNLLTVTVNEGGLISHKSVCQRCQNMIENQNYKEAKLLMENS